jgi:hypothetical protein
LYPVGRDFDSTDPIPNERKADCYIHNSGNQWTEKRDIEEHDGNQKDSYAECDQTTGLLYTTGDSALFNGTQQRDNPVDNDDRNNDPHDTYENKEHDMVGIEECVVDKSNELQYEPYP